VITLRFTSTDGPSGGSFAILAYLDPASDLKNWSFQRFINLPAGLKRPLASVGLVADAAASPYSATNWSKNAVDAYPGH
jgi:hypothetical protein